jgi:hypothetical protein
MEEAIPFTVTVAVGSLTVPVSVRGLVLTTVPSLGEVILTVRGGAGALRYFT